MTAASPSSWPGSRVLLGWWRDLHVWRPRQLWFGRLILHRVEAAVSVARSHPLDAWQRALLRQLSLRVPCAGRLEEHLANLHLDCQVLTQLVRELTEAGLLHRNGAERWDLTNAGRHALATGSRSASSEERRTLYFVDHSALDRPPQFIPLQRSLVSLSDVGQVPAGAPFALAHLETCLRQSPEWKARHHFPTEVEHFLPPHADAPAAANWSRVLLAAQESLPLVLLKTEADAGEPAVLGFAVRVEGWTLEPKPVLAFGEEWPDVLPDLARESAPEMWHQAWQTWCHPRGLPTAEIEACRLEPADYRLLVHAPPRLIDRLRASRSDAVKQEAWLLAGEGRIRSAARIELMEIVP